jgi:hypothetical protein
LLLSRQCLSSAKGSSIKSHNIRNVVAFGCCCCCCCCLQNIVLDLMPIKLMFVCSIVHI